jgi:hypothetical protein
MAAITRPSSGGYGTRRTGSFSGKTFDSHPVSRITRPMSSGHGTRRAGSFGGKTPDDGTDLAPDWIILARRRGVR